DFREAYNLAPRPGEGRRQALTLAGEKFAYTRVEEIGKIGYLNRGAGGSHAMSLKKWRLLLVTKEYSADGHTIYHGEAVEVLKTIETGSVDLIFADPPYNIGKDFDGIH